MLNDELINQTQVLTLNPNLGGFGQTEVEIVLQNPVRICGFLPFYCLGSINVCLSKKQFEKVQIAALNF